MPRGLKLTAITLIVFALTIGDAHAAIHLSGVASGGMFSSVRHTFERLSTTWYSRLFDDARILFTVLAGLEVTWLSLQWLLARRTFDELVPSLTKKVIVIGFFLALLINANTWITDLMNGFTAAGQTASGLGLLSPSRIMSYGLSDSVRVLGGAPLPGHHHGGTILGNYFHSAVTSVKDAVDPAMWLEGLERVLIAGVLFFSFLMTAVEMLVLLIEAYIILGAGVLFLGFGASRWTTKFVDGYLNFAVSVGTKLFVIYLVVGGINAAVIPALNKQLTGLGNLHLADILAPLALLIAASMIAKKIPEHAGALLGGGSGMTAGGFGGEAGRAALIGGMTAAVGTTATVATGGLAAPAALGGAAAAGAGAGAGAGAAAGAGTGAAAGTAAGAGTGAAAAGGGVAAAPGAAGAAAPGAAGAAAPGGASQAATGGASQAATGGTSQAAGASQAASPGASQAAGTSSAPSATSAGANSGTAPTQQTGQQTGQQAGTQQDARTTDANAQQQPIGHQKKDEGGAKAPSFESMKKKAQGFSRGVGNAARSSDARVQSSHISTSHGNDG